MNGIYLKELRDRILNNRELLYRVLLSAGAIILLLVTVPQIGGVVASSARVGEKKKTLIDVEEGMLNFSSLEQERDQLLNAYRSNLRSVPGQEEFPLFLEDVSRVGREQDIKIVAIEPRRAVDSPDQTHVKISIMVDAYCGYHQLGRFVSNLESADRLMKVTGIKLQKSEVDSERHHVLLNVTAFCLKEGIYEQMVR